ncbi:MAG: hypothetical protein GH155_02050 [Spirochaeta sp.]|nr:hypothetical protein [Spirochaeta sp.]
MKFPVTDNGEHLYTFLLIITDPHPRNLRHAWTFKDLSQSQLQACRRAREYSWKKIVKKRLKIYQSLR